MAADNITPVDSHALSEQAADEARREAAYREALAIHDQADKAYREAMLKSFRMQVEVRGLNADVDSLAEDFEMKISDLWQGTTDDAPDLVADIMDALAVEFSARAGQLRAGHIRDWDDDDADD